MWQDRVSNSGPLTYESGALPTALCGPAITACQGEHPVQNYFEVHAYKQKLWPEQANLCDLQV